jgi:4-amino-4-deoxy-L-arabinose transferase-like glycosyltransferase
MSWLQRGHFSSLGSLAYRTPGYPGFLAAIYSIAGHSWRAAGFVQAVLGAVTSGLLVLLAAKVLSRRGCVIAGVLHAVSPTALAYVPVLASETLAVFLLVSGLLGLAVAQERVGGARYLLSAVSGALLGLLLLVRPAGVFFLPALLVLAIYSRGRRTWRARPGLVFLGATLLALSPWLIRNHLAGLGPATLSTAGGENLLMGNNDRARLGGFQEGVIERRNLPEKVQDGQFRKAALAWIRSHPGRYLALSGIRAGRLLGIEPDTWAAKYLVPTRENDRAFTASFLYSWEGARSAPPALLDRAARVEHRNAEVLKKLRMVLAPLALLALVLSCLRWRNYVLILLPTLAYLGGLSFTYAEVRFRELVDPLLFILVAGLLADFVFSTSEVWPRPWRQSNAYLSARETAKGILAGLWKAEAPETPNSADLLAEETQAARRQEAAGYQFSPVQLTDHSLCLRQSASRSIRASRVDDGLSCEIVSSSDASAGRSGGISFRAIAPRALRLKVSFLEPGNIQAVSIAGYDGTGERCRFKWRWQVQGAQRPPRGPQTYVLVPDRQSGHFLPEGASEVEGTREIRLLLEIAPNCRAGFIVHKFEIAT